MATAAAEVVAVAAKRGTVLRALGGIAVAWRCPTAQPPNALAREFSDLDFVAPRRESKAIAEAFASVDFTPAQRFNALQSGSRMRFDYRDAMHADVFLEDFRMCHTLRLARRLGIHDRTVSLADLLLTKLQVVKLTAKDVSDIAALLLDHPVTDDESGINGGYIADLLASDWGWWRTVTETLRRISSAEIAVPVGPDDVSTIANRASTLEQLIAAAPKSLKWRGRSRLGDRYPWREEPEDLDVH